MADETYSFAAARARLDEIVSQVRKKDVSLEQSLDLLEEGVRLANSCTELIDHTEWRAAAAEAAVEEDPSQVHEDPQDASALAADSTEASEGADEAPGAEPRDAAEAATGDAEDADAAESDPADEAWAEG